MVNSLKPSLGKLAVFGCIFVLQFLMVGSSSVTYTLSSNDIGEDSGEYLRTYGLGAPVAIGHTRGESYVDINWVALVTSAMLFYLLALVLCWTYSRVPARVRWLKIGGIAATVMILLTFVGAVCISKYYWGYYFSRPPVISEIWKVASVERITPVYTDWAVDKPRSLQLWDYFSITECLAEYREDPYYSFNGRLLAALEVQGLLPETHSTDFSRVPPLLDLLNASGMRVMPKAGYVDSDPYGGLVVQAQSQRGENWLFLGLFGGRVSDDHLPYYELLFVAVDDGAEWHFVRGQQFFYDSAGLEGMEWYVIWRALSMVLVPLCWLALALLYGFLWLMRRRFIDTTRLNSEAGEARIDATDTC